MSRMSYKTVLRAKGIKPIPRDAGKLRSSVLLRAETICATTSTLNERWPKINSDTPLTGGDNQA